MLPTESSIPEVFTADEGTSCLCDGGAGEDRHLCPPLQPQRFPDAISLTDPPENVYSLTSTAQHHLALKNSHPLRARRVGRTLPLLGTQVQPTLLPNSASLLSQCC